MHWTEACFVQREVGPQKELEVFVKIYDVIKMQRWLIFAIFLFLALQMVWLLLLLFLLFLLLFSFCVNESGFYFQGTTYAKQAGIDWRSRNSTWS